VRPGVRPNDALPPLGSIDHDTLSVAALGTDAQASKLLEQSGLI
jgi:hypothetical protein